MLLLDNMSDNIFTVNPRNDPKPDFERKGLIATEQVCRQGYRVQYNCVTRQ